MRKLLSCIVLILALCFGVSGCESGDCILSSESYCSMSFVDAQGKSVKLLDTLSVLVNLNEYDTAYVYQCDTDVIITSAPVDSLSVKGYILSLLVERKQGVLLNRMTGANELELPLSFTAECDTFFFQYSARLSDTVWVKHQNHPYFSSMDCGTVMHYDIVGVKSTTHLIDSIQVVSSDVTNISKENVKIYFTVNN